MDLQSPSGGEAQPFHPSPVVVGESLVDCFSDGRQVVGGAPLNVAWNLRGLGRSPCFISAVGQDEQGRRILRALEGWGLSTANVSVLEEHPTGRVSVDLSGGEPSYEIVYPVAYDDLPAPSSSLPAAGHRLLYLGSLAWRRPESQTILAEWISRFGGSRFVDVNIREPWFSTSVLRSLVSGARYVKLNVDELSRLTQRQSHSPAEVAAAVASFREQFGGEIFFITCGSRGAYAVCDGELAFAPAPSPPRLRDTVGAGDAFAAAVIDGLLDGRDLRQCIDRGVGLAARVCGIDGATSENRALYEQEFMP